MSLIVRIDVDRPYGRRPLARHLLSRCASDYYLPRVNAFGYLRELEKVFDVFHRRNAKAHVFFRRCTLPTPALLARMRHEGHVAGLHLENSRSFETFMEEKQMLEHHIGQPVWAFSKHGSGGQQFGWHHHAPYEPEHLEAWGRRAGMKLFLGNLENPTLLARADETGFIMFPSAFWLEPAWRDTAAFPVTWLIAEARKRDVVLLIHPENVLASSALMNDLDTLLGDLNTKVLGANRQAA